MDKIPFSVYDFFAYLSAGAVIIITCDYVSGLRILGEKETGLVLGVALVILAYVIGHVIAHFSSFFFEQLAVHRLLGPPSDLLLGSAPRLMLFRWVFPNYHRPLPKSTRQQIQLQAAAHSCASTDEGFFQHAYPIVTASEAIQARLDVFRNQYGFARNVSFAFFVSALVIAAAQWCGSQAVQLRWAVLAAVFGIALFYRYLKFFRQYSYELLIRYAALPLPEETKERVGI